MVYTSWTSTSTRYSKRCTLIAHSTKFIRAVLFITEVILISIRISRTTWITSRTSNILVTHLTSSCLLITKRSATIFLRQCLPRSIIHWSNSLCPFPHIHSINEPSIPISNSCLPVIRVIPWFSISLISYSTVLHFSVVRSIHINTELCFIFFIHWIKQDSCNRYSNVHPLVLECSCIICVLNNYILSLFKFNHEWVIFLEVELEHWSRNSKCFYFLEQVPVLSHSLLSKSDPHLNCEVFIKY
jgi:hypothetical protein